MKIILVLFALGVAIRFLYFPNNVYFAYDQARDAFTSLEIIKGDFKVIGPPSAASDNLFPGPLVYYIFAPIYFLFDKNPVAVAGFLHIYNALGVFLAFLLGSTIFNKKVGLISALLFAISYEQSQYSLFISHQPLAVIPVLLFYLGLSYLFFRKEKWGLVLSILGLGLSIQLHYVYILLILPFVALLVVLRKNVPPLKLQHILMSVAILLLTLSTYILAEIKFDFRFLSEASKFLQSSGGTRVHFKETLFVANRFLHDTFLANYQLIGVVWLLLLITIISFLSNKKLRPKIAFLIFWFLGGLLPYLLSGTPSYYYGAAASVSLLILASFVISRLLTKKLPIALLLLSGIIFNSLYLISRFNPRGPNSDIVIQPGMLISDEKRAIDYIYLQTKGEPFAINGLTIPLSVNTTWSYLFEWYGKQKYHYLPTWGGNAAAGFPGSLVVVKDRAKLPKAQFMIIEPTVGIREGYKDNFFREESYFTKVLEEKKFGTITVQKRQKI
ncbi:MAG: glycosyltransferase family 39 protein [bacterium]|nr:glycosyltransferase family 39 protein [bacterium]